MKSRRKKLSHQSGMRRFKEFLHKKRRLLFVAVALVVVAVVVITGVSSHPVSATIEETDAAKAADAQAAPDESGAANEAEAKSLSSVESEPAPLPESTEYTALKEGDENSQVQILQDRLMDLGYMDFDEPTSVYGASTAYAVELFQRQHVLEQDGVAGPEILELLYSDQAKPYTLLQGTSGNDVDALQRRLIDLGYMDKSTGYYGTETIEAVKAFQEQNDLEVDGKTGEITLSLIYSPDAQQSTMKPAEVARRANILEVLATAEDQLGDPYVWGAEGPDSFDCSGLVYYCLREAGSSRGRYDAAGYSSVSDWEKITDMDNLEKGDLLFFSTNGKRVGHTGIYMGEGMMIDASSSNGEVVYRVCKNSFWEGCFVCARRPW